jgi:hypothetical protein
MMSLSFRVSNVVTLLCLLPATATALAQDDVEIPQGYEDAPVAGEAAPAATGDMEDGDLSLIEVLAGALAEEANPNVVNLQRQFLPQYQQLWKAELGFLQRVCSLTREQREQIEAAADGIVRTAAREHAVAQDKMMHGGRDPFGGGQSTARDPYKLLQQQIAEVAKGKLNPEQASRYQEEWDKRNAHRQRVTVLNLVVLLDEHLMLTAEQRDKLVEALSVKYQGRGWGGQALDLFQHNPQYLPAIPDQQIVPILNSTQKTIWQSAQKLDPSSEGGFGFVRAMAVIDDGDVFVEDVMIEEQ